jgi:predicted nucleotidyltransferase
MQKVWLKKPKLTYSKDVLDIVQFGSSVEEEKTPRDIDIAVIFNRIPLKEQLNQAQEIKKQLEKFTDIPIHINSFDLYSLFDNSNFAKENILFAGKSIIHEEYFAKTLSLTPKVQIYYSLENLKKKDKIRFNYMLNGKGGEYGLLRKHNGKLLKPGLIEISPEHEYLFTNSIKEFKISFQTKKIIFS